MKENKIYTQVNATLKLLILKAELSENSINTTLSLNGVEEFKIEKIQYTEITSINISLTDFNKHQILIKLKSGKNLKLSSLSYGKLRNGRIKRETIDQLIEFNYWVSELYKILIDKKLTQEINFTEGNNSKAIMFTFMFLFCIFASILSFSYNGISPFITFISTSLFFAYLLFKSGYKKKYNPEIKLNK